MRAESKNNLRQTPHEDPRVIGVAKWNVRSHAHSSTASAYSKRLGWSCPFYAAELVWLHIDEETHRKYQRTIRKDTKSIEEYLTKSNEQMSLSLDRTNKSLVQQEKSRRRIKHH